MVSLADLWLPILLSAVFVFIASSVLHMALRYHTSDHAIVPGEAEVLEAMRKSGVAPGSYRFPYCSTMEELSTEEMTEKFSKGPVGFMTIFPNGPIAMGKNLGIWFVYTLVVSAFVAYLGSFSIQDESVFRFTATAAAVAYCLPGMSDTAWKGQSWSVTMKFAFDGLVYAVCTGAAFQWFWPAS